MLRQKSISGLTDGGNMLRKIKEYFKNTDRTQIYQDIYAGLFSAAGVCSIIYLVSLAVRK